MTSPSTESAPFLAPGVFPPTHWSLVLAARSTGDSQASMALERLCQTYWPPVYRFILREVREPANAQDLTQEFFARFISKDHLQHLQHQEGRFRSFLLAFVRHFLADQRDRDRAQKRGGGLIFISLDQFNDEDQRPAGPIDSDTPEHSFDRRWAQTLLEHAIARLKAEYEVAGNALLFDVLKDLQPGERGPDGYEAIARRLNTSESAIKSAMHRLRRRHREILREEIGKTVSHPAEIDAEIRHILQVFGDSN